MNKNDKPYVAATRSYDERLSDGRDGEFIMPEERSWEDRNTAVEDAGAAFGPGSTFMLGAAIVGLGLIALIGTYLN